MPDVFVSYAREDLNRIEPIVRRLRADGFIVWWDQNISGGAAFARETESKLREAKAILVAWSHASIDSLWVADEATVGREKNNLVPIAIDAVSPPIGFRQLQTIAFDGATDTAYLELRKALATKVSAAGVVSLPLAPANGPALVQRVQYCRGRDGARLAHATMGEGYPVVKTANWLTHIDHDLNSFAWGHLIRNLASQYRLVRYDTRGMGLSDWNIERMRFEDFVSDFAAIVDSAGLDRFALLGFSQGCAVAVAYAAAHPDRVSSLALTNGYVRGWRKRLSETGIKREEAFISLIDSGWNDDNPAVRQLFTSSFAPDASKEQMDSFNEFFRRAAPARNAAMNLRAVAEIDVSDQLAEVRAPTLVFQVENDGMLPNGVEEARRFASEIPDAELVMLEGRNHLILENDATWPRYWSKMKAFIDAHASS